MWSGSIDQLNGAQQGRRSREMPTQNSAQEPLLAPAGSEHESLLYQSVDMSGFNRKPPPVRSTSCRDLPAYITQRQSPSAAAAPVVENWRTIVDPKCARSHSTCVQLASDTLRPGLTQAVCAGIR